MRQTLKVFMVILFVCSTLVSCVNYDEKAERAVNNETSEHAAQLRQPPDLTVEIGEDIIYPKLGRHNWSYIDSEGSEIHMDADSEPPPVIYQHKDPEKLISEEKALFHFDSAPFEYFIKEWHPDGDNGIAGTYEQLNLSDHEGIKIFEVLASWAEGTASYTFYLDID